MSERAVIAEDPRPVFPVSVLREPRPPGTPVESLDGREWGRVLFAAPSGLDDRGFPVDETLEAVAAESEDGTVHIWDAVAVFKALFPPEV